jgi:uncharacterized membrane protein YphA (DoxX/SURF4 family)
MTHTRAPQDRMDSFAPWIAFARIFLGVFWLFEVTIGHNWKVGHPGWIGPGAGEKLVAQAQEGIAAGTFPWFVSFLETFVFPYAAAWSYTVTGLQVVLGIALVVGIMVRPLILVALGMDLVIYLVGNSRIPPFFTIGHVLLFATNAGHFHGLDGLLAKRLEGARSLGARTVRFLATVDIFTPTVRVVLGSVSAVIGMYFFLHMVMMPTPKMAMVNMEIAAIAGLVSFGLFASARTQVADLLPLAFGLLRIFIGFKFLHEIVVRNVPAINGLPGWGTAEQLEKVFITIAANHYGVVANLMNGLFIPSVGFWALLIAVVQTVVGVALILGLRTRLSSAIGIGFLALLILLGFTRYAPFVLGYMIALYVLDAGRALSLDRYFGFGHGAFAPRLSPLTTAGFLALLVLATTAAVVTGVAPDGYTATMAGMTASMVALFAFILGSVGVLQNYGELRNLVRPPARTSQPKATPI